MRSVGGREGDGGGVGGIERSIEERGRQNLGELVREGEKRGNVSRR